MTKRTLTKIDQIAQNWVDDLVKHDPTVGTYIGRYEANEFLPDYSPESVEGFVQKMRDTLAELKKTATTDSVDDVTKTDLAAGLKLSIKQVEAGEHLRDLNVIASPVQDVRDIFDLMPTESSTDWEVIAKRMRGVRPALRSYAESLREGVKQNKTPAIRQVAENIEQSRRNAKSFYQNLIKSSENEASFSSALKRELSKAANEAANAYSELANFLSEELAPHAQQEDAFGRERYELASEAFLGARVDLDETYEWGIEELMRMTLEQENVAAQILGVSSRHVPLQDNIVQTAIEKLDGDPARKLHGTKALQEWMQKVSDQAVAELGATQFDIPAEIRTLECMIAPNNEGGIYYTGPSDDFSRPGRMWWSVPDGVTEFDTWRELTTVYHEGVPGHHLQIGQAVVNRNELNEWRRQLAGTSGHAEGWALYAERLMEELGYLDDPADRLGMLDGQRMRAARVVLDIGVHLGKAKLSGSGVWDADYALEFMRQNVNMNDGFLRFEVNRYLGWAGQAPSYKVGQRIWEQLRDEAAAAAKASGEEFSLRDFHSRALAIGGVRLDTLQKTLKNKK